MPAVALTDHGNMMGAFHFVKEIGNYNRDIREKNKLALEANEPADAQEIKGIVGCEFFVCEDHTNKSQKDNGYQVVFLAKTKKGYHNLVKMSSKAYTDGFYYLPRIDRTIVETYKEDLIVLTGNLIRRSAIQNIKCWRASSRRSPLVVEREIWSGFVCGAHAPQTRR